MRLCTGDIGAVAQGTHAEVKQDVVLRLETLTVLETKVRNRSNEVLSSLLGLYSTLALTL